MISVVPLIPFPVVAIIIVIIINSVIIIIVLLFVTRLNDSLVYTKAYAAIDGCTD